MLYGLWTNICSRTEAINRNRSTLMGGQETFLGQSDYRQRSITKQEAQTATQHKKVV